MQISNIWNSESGAIGATFESLIQQRGYTHRASRYWRANVHPVEHSATHSALDDSGKTYICEQDNALVKMWGNGYNLLVTVVATTEALAEAILRTHVDRYPAARADSPDNVTVNFWTRTHQGPNNTKREVMVPAWSDVAHNYPVTVRSQLDYLMSGYRANPEGGKLLLWTGPPGTGKTYALRSLAREWRHWCEFHYIIDPEAFYAGPADYLFQVALAQRGQDYDWDFDEDDPRQEAKRPKWRLIVCEDTGELLSADAKNTTGTALSRFLNVCDGIIGQGLQVQILITTNEDIKTFHPAVIRPGRAASSIRFDKFKIQEARLWLGEEGNGRVSKDLSLAEMYAMSQGRDPASVLDSKTAGFLAS